ncbi:hypothetical protein ENBRE01_0927 [Enteropsectra breve]|nr:hypothetical protein ENBRE01_0927 [Enteropsectra breve]
MSEDRDQKAQDFLKHLSGLSFNQQCADCAKPGPTWVNLSLGVFICHECAGKHRAMSTVVQPRVRSTVIDKLSLDDLRILYVGGNKHMHHFENNSNLNVKYKDAGAFIKDLEKRTAESEAKEPGDSFLESKSKAPAAAFGKAAIKKQSMPKFGSKINFSQEKEEPKKVLERKKEEPPVKIIESSQAPARTVFSRNIKNTSNMKKDIDSSRSPFSFKPAERENKN